MSDKLFLAQRDKKIRELYAQGKTVTRLAEIYGLTRQRIAMIVKDLPKHFGMRLKGNARVNALALRRQKKKERVDRILALYNAGQTQIEIAQQFGTAQTNISRIIRRAKRSK